MVSTMSHDNGNNTMGHIVSNVGRVILGTGYRVQQYML